MKGLVYKCLPTFWYLEVFIYKIFSPEHKKEVGF